MILKTQTVYVPTSASGAELQVGRIDKRDYYKSFEKERDVEEVEAFVFTPDELRQLLEQAIAHGLHSFEDFDANSNYDEESREEGLKEIQNEFIDNTISSI